MQIMPAYYTSTKTTRKSKSTKKTAAQIEHEKWLSKKGLMNKQSKKDKNKINADWKKEYKESLKVDRENYVSGGMSGSKDSCAKRGIMTNLHKEPKEVQEQVLYKASRVMPLFNKGGLQYATPGEDMKQVGTKTRR